MYEIILASQSPRRRALLEEAGYEFQTRPVELSEKLNKNMKLEDALVQLAQTKAEALIQSVKPLELKGKIILAGDTVVVLNEQVLGKPKNFTQAQDFLTRLSGKSHCVMTALALFSQDQSRWATAVEKTVVTFRPLGADEIEGYIHSGEPMDKAGAYAIQGEGRKFVSEYKGSWSNVVGLPLERLQQILDENGWKVRRRSLA